MSPSLIILIGTILGSAIVGYGVYLQSKASEIVKEPKLNLLIHNVENLSPNLPKYSHYYNLVNEGDGIAYITEIKLAEPLQLIGWRIAREGQDLYKPAMPFAIYPNEVFLVEIDSPQKTVHGDLLGFMQSMVIVRFSNEAERKFTQEFGWNFTANRFLSVLRPQ